MSPHYSTDWRNVLNRVKQTLDIPPEKQKAANVIINSFRQGSPPRDGIRKVTVGLSSTIAIFERKLRRARDGACSFTLINGKYGSGKSHCLYLLREMALENNYLVALLTLSQRECPLYDLGKVYSHIMHRIESKKQSKVATFLDILDLWVEGIRRQGKHSLETVKHKIKKLHPDFQEVLAQYVCPSTPGIEELVKRWLIGDDSTGRTANYLNVTMKANNEQALNMLKQISELIRTIGFAGLVVLLDEAEAIPSYSGSTKQELCYENLCKLLKRENRIPHCYFVYATTPKFFHETHDRVPVSESSSEVHNLLRFSFDEYVTLGIIIRDLYQVAEERKGSYSSFDDQQINLCVESYLRFHHKDLKPRNFVRTLVSALDICAPNPHKKLSDIFSLRERAC